jgi:hypothetical protein
MSSRTNKINLRNKIEQTYREEHIFTEDEQICKREKS